MSKALINGDVTGLTKWLCLRTQIDNDRRCHAEADDVMEEEQMLKE